MAGIVLERKRTADHIKKEQMKLDYAEVVSKLLIYWSRHVIKTGME